MWKSFLAGIALLGAVGPLFAATAVNKDNEARTLVVTENGDKTELELAAGETAQFCAQGCFVTLPNGDLEALTGSETIEISGGVARVK